MKTINFLWLFMVILITGCSTTNEARFEPEPRVLGFEYQVHQHPNKEGTKIILYTISVTPTTNIIQIDFSYWWDGKWVSLEHRENYDVHGVQAHHIVQIGDLDRRPLYLEMEGNTSKLKFMFYTYGNYQNGLMRNEHEEIVRIK